MAGIAKDGHRHFAGGKIDLPNCCSLTLLTTFAYKPHTFEALSTLPIVDLTLQHEHSAFQRWDDWFDMDVAALIELQEGVGAQPWRDLKHITFDGYLWFTISNSGDQGRAVGRMAFADWSFEVLHVNLTKHSIDTLDPDDLDLPSTFSFLLQPGWSVLPGEFFEGLERVELKLKPQAEKNLLRATRWYREETPPDPVRDMWWTLIVLVGSDGTERKLIESAE